LYALPRRGPRVLRYVDGTADALRSELSVKYYQKYEAVPPNTALTDALRTLEGRARASPSRETLHLRSAWQDGAIYLDLGDATGRAIKATAQGWDVVEEPPALFYRSSATGSLPVPERGGDIDALRKLLNVKRGVWPLFVAWLVAALIPNIAHPILNVNGEHGTGKSMFSRLTVRLLDPSAAELRAMPSNELDWIVSANASYVVALDNISAISRKMSDALCRAVTGDAFVARKLYTNADVSVLAFKRVLLLNGIGVNHLAGDLADRILNISLAPIKGAGRRLETELFAAFDRAHPQFLGALLDLLVRVLEVRPTVYLAELPRMADFAEIVAAVDQIRDTNALETYLDQASELALTVLEGDEVGQALRQLLEDEGSWSGRSMDLLEHLHRYEQFHNSLHRPKTAEAMSKDVTRLAPALRQLNFKIDRGKGRAQRDWIMSSPPRRSFQDLPKRYVSRARQKDPT
jgi:hypothetical protein